MSLFNEDKLKKELLELLPEGEKSFYEEQFNYLRWGAYNYTEEELNQLIKETEKRIELKEKGDKEAYYQITDDLADYSYYIKKGNETLLQKAVIQLAENQSDYVAGDEFEHSIKIILREKYLNKENLNDVEVINDENDLKLL